MHFNIHNTKVEVKFLFVALITLLMFVDKTGVFLYCFVASLLHEMGHITAMFIFNDPPLSMIFEAYGICINKRENTSYFKQTIILLAGPLINIILGIMFYRFGGESGKIFSASNFSLALFNLLPLRGLDGGEIIMCILEYFFGYKTSNIISIVISSLFLVPLLIFAIYNFSQNQNNFSLLLVIIFLILSITKSIRD